MDESKAQHERWRDFLSALQDRVASMCTRGTRRETTIRFRGESTISIINKVYLHILVTVFPFVIIVLFNIYLILN